MIHRKNLQTLCGKPVIFVGVAVIQTLCQLVVIVPTRYQVTHSQWCCAGHQNIVPRGEVTSQLPTALEIGCRYSPDSKGTTS